MDPTNPDPDTDPDPQHCYLVFKCLMTASTTISYDNMKNCGERIWVANFELNQNLHN